AEVDGVIFRARRAVGENLYAHQARDRGDAVTVLIKLAEGLVTVAQEVHLASVDHLLEIFFRHREPPEDVLQLIRDRHSRFARVEAIKLFAPPVQLDLRFAVRVSAFRFLDDVVNDVVNRAAEGVNVNDRIALGFRQEEERIEKVRLDGLRQFAAQIPRALAQMTGGEMNLFGLDCFHAKSLKPRSLNKSPR